ncbi:hypothetical protein ACS106_004374 [Escherichia coli]
MMKQFLLYGVLILWVGTGICAERFPSMQNVQKIDLRTKQRVITDTTIEFDIKRTSSSAVYTMAGCGAAPGTTTTTQWTSLIDRNATGFSTNNYINTSNWAYLPNMDGKSNAYRVTGTWETNCTNPVMWIGWWNNYVQGGSYIKWGNVQIGGPNMIPEVYIALPGVTVAEQSISVAYPSTVQLTRKSSAKIAEITGGETVVSVSAAGAISNKIELYTRTRSVGMSEVIHVGGSAPESELWVGVNGDYNGEYNGTVTITVGTV